MNVKQFATLKNSFDRRKELKEFEQYLKDNPLQESEYRDLIEDTNMDMKQKVDYLNQIQKLRKAKLIIDDIPETWEDFSSRMEENGIVPIKASVMKQMNNDEFTQLTSKRFQQYDDMGGTNKKVVHFEYRSKRGLIEKLEREFQYII